MNSFLSFLKDNNFRNVPIHIKTMCQNIILKNQNKERLFLGQVIRIYLYVYTYIWNDFGDTPCIYVY